MTTLRAVALRLEGPLQAWGGPTAGDDRPTLDFPTKSGVLGLVAAAMGIVREDVATLAALHRSYAFGVRIDSAGQRGVDFHTAQDVPRAERGAAETVVSRRGYLYDASFAALLVEHSHAIAPLATMLEALRRPRFAPFLGRRSCPPAVPVLALPNIIEAPTWVALFAQVPVARNAAGKLDAFVEGAAVDAPLRQLRLRDALTGPLPRFFHERQVTHLQLPAPEVPRARDTVDAWFPS